MREQNVPDSVKDVYVHGQVCVCVVSGTCGSVYVTMWRLRTTPVQQTPDTSNESCSKVHGDTVHTPFQRALESPVYPLGVPR